MTQRSTLILLALLAAGSSYGAVTDPCNGVMNGILHSIAGKPTYTNLQRESVVEAQRRAEKILSLRSKGVTEKTMTSHLDRQDLIYVYGVPEKIQKIEHPEQLVFRHYSAESAAEIVESQSLKAGPRPYIHPEAHTRWEYQDMSGVMFTLPSLTPKIYGWV